MRVTRKDYVYYMESSLIFPPCPAVRNASQKVVFQRFNPCIVPLTNMTDGGITMIRGFARVPSGKLSHNYGKSPCFMGKFTINGDFP